MASEEPTVQNGAQPVDDVVEAADIDESLQPFEISLHLPRRPLLPSKGLAGLPETPSPLTVAVTPQETLNDLRVTITDSPEGYWLGAFCFRRPAPGQAGKKAGSKATLGERVGEWIELREVFKDVPKGQRELHVTHVPFNEADARAHVQRLRDLLTGGQADPTAIGIDAGISVQDAVKNPEAWTAATTTNSSSNQQSGSKKGGKGKNASSSAATAGGAESQTDAAAEQGAKLPFADWEEWKSTGTSSLIPPQAHRPRQLPTCLRHLSLSSWNPPPQQHRLQGHLLYLQVGTLEGEHIYITASTHGFYISRTTGSKFDPSPRPAGQDFASCSLFDLLCGFSPLFLTNFAKLFNDPVSSRDYFSAVPVTNAMPAHPWLARQHNHHVDPLRSQTAYLLTGATSADTLEGTRDWNDELQSTRELPRTNLPERLMRDRVLNRVFAEFTQAAARAVPRVAAGEVQAMNPMDRRDAQMFIVNNLFISKGADGVDIYPHMGGDEAAHVAVGKDVQGIKTLNSLDVDGLCLLGTVVVDWKGERWVAQSIVPGLFRRRDDDAVAEAEVGEGEVKADAAADAAKDEAGSKDDAKVEDKKQQERKPNGEPARQDPNDDTQVVYGGVEGPEVIRKDAAFHRLFGQVAHTLHLSEHEVEDAKHKKHSLWLSVDSKGLRGADGRKYVLDLARLNPVDVNWLERDMDGEVLLAGEADPKAAAYPHRMALLRPELLEIFWDSEFRKWAREKLAARQEAKKAIADKEKAEGESGDATGEDKDKDKDKEPEPERIDSSDFKLSFNPDAFAEFKVPDESAEGESKVITPVSDESDASVAAVRAAGTFLREVAVPRFVTDVAAGLFSAPDGAALSRQMHARGINVRYLGYVARLCEADQKDKLDEELIKKAGPGHEGFLRTFRSVVLQEMVLRAAKRILRTLLRDIEQVETSACVSHFLNCLVGAAREPSPKPDYRRSPFADAEDPAWTELTPESLASQIRAQVRQRFRYELPQSFLATELRKKQLLREVALRCGIQLKLQDYDLDGPAPSSHAANGAASDESAAEVAQVQQPNGTDGSKKKKKKGGNGGAAVAAANGTKSRSAADAADPKKAARTTAFEPSDVLNLLPVVKDSTPKSTLAEEAFEAGRISISRGDRELGIELLLEGVSFHEQIYGLVHPEVARCYALFATIIHHFAGVVAMETAERMRQAQAEGQENPQIEVPPINEQLTMANAVRYQRQAVTVSERTLGLDHPETLNQYMNLAVLERSEGNTEASLLCQQRVLDLWETIYGRDHPDCVNALSNIALTLQNARLFESSLKLYQSAHELALRIFGPDSIHTANLAHELSQALTLTGDLKTALTVEKEAWRVFEERLGKEDAQTKESEAFCLSLAASAVRVAKLEKEAKANEARKGGFGMGATTRPRQSAAAAVAQVAEGASSNRSLDDIVRYIQGGATGAPSPSRGKGKAKAGLKTRK
ncbi:probable Clustered mitochondria protein homolog [Pseudozyma flocculosa]|uniref:Clustered mitochondria protein homolog n=1 Tax=Pseudozyma flocculosa TaxID=84751 RepID=A0A5C3EXN6_9BASI|nr:probable Clustered mitochondria protein homolog [Pseudozyma flocculosa]